MAGFMAHADGRKKGSSMEGWREWIEMLLAWVEEGKMREQKATVSGLRDDLSGRDVCVAADVMRENDSCGVAL